MHITALEVAQLSLMRMRTRSRDSAMHGYRIPPSTRPRRCPRAYCPAVLSKIANSRPLADSQLPAGAMSEYAVVKSLLSCLSSSFAFSVNSVGDKAPLLRLIVDNIRQAIEHKGLSATTQKFLLQVLEHMKRYETGAIDSTELDYLIDSAVRDCWSRNDDTDMGVRIFVKKPSVS